MFVLFAAGVEVSIALGIVGMLGLLWLKGFTIGLGVVGSIAWSNASSFSFIAVPLFVFMSGILLHSGIGKGLYTAVARWVSFLPGGLAVASIFSCAIFAAISGSSVGTAATIGDRKSTRLNSSHRYISYSVFCFEKKKNAWVPC